MFSNAQEEVGTQIISNCSHAAYQTHSRGASQNRTRWFLDFQDAMWLVRATSACCAS